MAIDKSSKFRGQGVIVEIEIPYRQENIRFQMNPVMQAYDPWVIRKSWKDGRYWGRRWQSDWDYDEYFDLKSDVDYVMGVDGKLINVEEQNQGSNKKENIQKSIQESQKKKSKRGTKKNRGENTTTE